MKAELALLRLFGDLERTEDRAEHLLGTERASLGVVDLLGEPLGEGVQEAMDRHARALLDDVAILNVVELEELYGTRSEWMPMLFLMPPRAYLDNAGLIKDRTPGLESDRTVGDDVAVQGNENVVYDDLRILRETLDHTRDEALRLDDLGLELRIAGSEEGEDEHAEQGADVGPEERVTGGVLETSAEETSDDL